MATRTVNASSIGTGTASNAGNALGAQNNTWTSDTGNVSWSQQWGMANEASGAFTGAQVFSGLIRKSASGGNDPTLSVINVLVNGSAVATTNPVGIGAVSSATGQVCSVTVDGSLIPAGATVSMELVTAGAGGSPSSRRALQIDYMQWQGEFVSSVPGRVKVRGASAWNEKPAKIWNGSAWVEKPVKVWSGTAWVLA